MAFHTSRMSSFYISSVCLCTGRYHCLLQQTSSHDLAHIISTLDISLQLQAIVPERDDQPEVTSQPLMLPFLPSFYVLTPEIQLSNLAPEFNFRVSASDKVLPDLKVQGSFGPDLDILE